MPNQSLTSQFPTHPNREFFTAYQGIKSADQGNFRPDQGKGPLARVLGRSRAKRPVAAAPAARLSCGGLRQMGPQLRFCRAHHRAGALGARSDALAKDEDLAGIGVRRHRPGCTAVECRRPGRPGGNPRARPGIRARPRPRSPRSDVGLSSAARAVRAKGPPRGPQPGDLRTLRRCGSGTLSFVADSP